MGDTQIEMGLGGAASEEEATFELPRPLSHSSITTYEDCPKKWYFRYIKKVPQEDKYFFSFGKSVHGVLEYFYKLKDYPDVKDLLRYYEENWITMGYESAAQEAEYKTKGVDIIEKYHAKHLKERQDPEKSQIAFGIEQKFDIVFGGAKITGYIDRLDKLSDGTLEVIDYKTGKALTRSRVVNDGQLTMYQVACKKKYGLDVGRLTFYHLNSQKVWSSGPRSAEQVNALEEKVREVAGEISDRYKDIKNKLVVADEGFMAKPDERKCGWCDYKPICPVYAPASAAGAAAAAAAAKEKELPVIVPDRKLSGLVSRFVAQKQKIKKEEDKIDAIHDELLEALITKHLLKNGATKEEVAEIKAHAKKKHEAYLNALMKALQIAVRKDDFHLSCPGADFTVTAHVDTRWEFKSDGREKLLELIKRRGYWEEVCAPTMSKVQSLLKSKTLPQSVSEEFATCGRKTAHCVLRIKKTEKEGE